MAHSIKQTYSIPYCYQGMRGAGSVPSGDVEGPGHPPQGAWEGPKRPPPGTQAPCSGAAGHRAVGMLGLIYAVLSLVFRPRGPLVVSPREAQARTAPGSDSRRGH